MARLRSLPLVIALVGLVACGEGDPDDKESPGGGGGSGGGSSGSGGIVIVGTGGTSSGGTTSSGGSANGGTSPSGGSAGMSSGGTGLYLPCESQMDCDQFGGGKTCCAVGAMHFCTKQSACSGDTLP